MAQKEKFIPVPNREQQNLGRLALLQHEALCVSITELLTLLANQSAALASSAMEHDEE